MSAAATWEDVLAGRARWAVCHGDNAEILPRMADGSVAVTIQDPPYEAEAHTSQRRINGKTSGDSRLVRDAPIAEFPPITEAERNENGLQVARLTRRWALTFCQVEAVHLWRASLTASKAHRYVRTSVFIKEDPQPQMTGDRPGMGWESIVITHPKGRPHWNGGGRCGVFFALSGKSVDRRDQRSLHPTQKPTELMLELVSLFTDPDDVILDPYCGSATTLVAALRLGRRAIGIEKSAHFVDIARRRMVAEESHRSLWDVEGTGKDQHSLFGEGA